MCFLRWYIVTVFSYKHQVHFRLLYNYSYLKLYFPHLLISTFCSVVLCAPRSYSDWWYLYIKHRPLQFLFNADWRANEHSWYSIIFSSEIAFLLNNLHLNTDHVILLRIHLMKLLTLFNINCWEKRTRGFSLVISLYTLEMYRIHIVKQIKLYLLFF